MPWPNWRDNYRYDAHEARAQSWAPSSSTGIAAVYRRGHFNRRRLHCGDSRLRLKIVCTASVVAWQLPLVGLRPLSLDLQPHLSLSTAGLSESFRGSEGMGRRGGKSWERGSKRGGFFTPLAPVTGTHCLGTSLCTDNIN